MVSKTNDSTPGSERPVRYCHGCRQYDDHPRSTVIADQNRPEFDKLYHIDCLPSEFHDEHLQPILDARASGKRGDKLAEFAADYAATLTEASADTNSEG